MADPENTREAASLVGSRWRRRFGRGDRGIPELAVIGFSATFVDEQGRPLLEFRYGRRCLTGWRGIDYLQAEYRRIPERFDA